MSNQIIRIEKQPRKNGGPRTVYILNCLDCSSDIKVRKADYNKNLYSGKCSSCSHRKLPFESQFNCFKSDWRKLKNTITYQQFLEFTKIKNCHYCTTSINWNEYGIVNGKLKGRSYFLDRKDNDLGYIESNCVVCCTKCNLAKGNRYTYQEWYGMTDYFRKLLTEIRK